MSEWKEAFERVGVRRSRCRLCGEEMDHAGGRPQRHLARKHGDAAPEAPATDLPPSAPEGPMRTLEARDTLLATLRGIANDSQQPSNARVQAANVIAQIEGFRDFLPEEDEDEGEARVVDRFRKAIEKKADLEEEFRRSLRDPATLSRVERLCAEVRATL